jgi:hypothetical protein
LHPTDGIPTSHLKKDYYSIGTDLWLLLQENCSIVDSFSSSIHTPSCCIHHPPCCNGLESRCPWRIPTKITKLVWKPYHKLFRGKQEKTIPQRTRQTIHPQSIIFQTKFHPNSATPTFEHNVYMD